MSRRSCSHRTAPLMADRDTGRSRRRTLLRAFSIAYAVTARHRSAPGWPVLRPLRARHYERLQLCPAPSAWLRRSPARLGSLGPEPHRDLRAEQLCRHWQCPRRGNAGLPVRSACKQLFDQLGCRQQAQNTLFGSIQPVCSARVAGGFTSRLTMWAGWAATCCSSQTLPRLTNSLDTKSGTSYFQAGAQLAALVDSNGKARRQPYRHSLLRKSLSSDGELSTTVPQPEKSQPRTSTLWSGRPTGACLVKAQR